MRNTLDTRQEREVGSDAGSVNRTTWYDICVSDKAFLLEMCELIDTRLASLEAECDTCSDPDGFGVYDRIEHACGLGFVVCQNFLESTCVAHGVPKGEALDFGPAHDSGSSVAVLVNHAANWWKHQLQWKGATWTPANERTRVGLSAMDLESDYPLVQALALLSGGDLRVSPLVPLLIEWHDALPRP